MGVPGSANLLLAAGSGAEAYQLEHALRFDSGRSTYLYKNGPVSITDGKKFTVSVWVKRAKLGANQCIMGGSPASTLWGDLKFQSDDRLVFRQYHTSGGPSLYAITTNAQYRDTSAWYHIVVEFDSTQSTSSNRVKLYVNGEQITSFQNASYPGQNYTNFLHTGNYAVGIGRLYNFKTDYFDGYMSELHYIDGTAYSASEFGEYNDNGQWVPKEVSGLTYGSKGTYLKFDPSAANGIGHNHAGSVHWDVANHEETTSSSLNYDPVSDTPTKNTSNWNRNFSTNQSNSHQLGTLTLKYSDQRATQGGNLTRGGYATGPLNIGGKYYWECRQGSSWGGQNGCATYAGFGVPRQTGNISTSISQWIWYGLLWKGTGRGQSSSTSATIYWNGSSQSTITLSNDWRPGRVAGIAIDTTASTSNVKLYVDGTLVGTGSFNFGSLPEDARLLQIYTAIASQPNQFCYLNAGSQPFQYTPPSGHVAPNTYNIPEPTIKNPGEYFNAVAYTGNGGTKSITGVGFQPDLVIIKDRTRAGNWSWQDSVRGSYRTLDSNTAQPENTSSNIDFFSSFNSDGFTVKYTASNGFNYEETNKSGDQYVAYCWKKSATAGFDIVTYTGNGTAGRTVSHSLGVKPSMMIVKCRSTTASWQVYHRYMGATKVMWLDQNQAANTSSVRWNNTEPTSSVFTVGTDGGMNQNGATYVAYLWAEVEGYSRFGDYEANGNSTHGPFVYTGFKPRFIMVKDQEAAGEWYVKDTARSTYNPDNKALKMNLNDSDSDNSIYQMDIYSNGFKIRTSNTSINNNSKRYIYMAFAEDPFKYATAR